MLLLLGLAECDGGFFAASTAFFGVYAFFECFFTLRQEMGKAENQDETLGEKKECTSFERTLQLRKSFVRIVSNISDF